MQREGVDVSALAGKGDELRTAGASVMQLAVDGRFAGILAVADPVKATTAEAISRLRAQGRAARHGRQNLMFAFLYNALGIPSPPACSTRGPAGCSRRCSPRSP